MTDDIARPAQDEIDAPALLKARAKRLAIVPEADAATEDLLEVVEFRLAGERYAFAAAYIREVFPLKQLTPIPCTPPFVAGMTNLRGELVSVIDLKRFFDLPSGELTGDTRIILLQGREMSFGILAEEVLGVRNIPVQQIQATLPTLTGIRAKYLHGVTEDRLAILEAVALLDDPELIVNETV